MPSRLSPTQLHWLDAINEHDLVIVYKPGKDNQLADGLSCHPHLEISAVAVLSGDEELYEQSRQGYMEDGTFKKVYCTFLHPNDPIDKGLATKIKCYEDVDGLLYYIADTRP
ncbi:hypothetical protein GGF37_001341 [Kickxella alabastrina]|nr:hypothetical protein GGF37_001341 [Kickxella alabastrina]